LIFREVEDRDLIAKARQGDVESYNLLVSRWEKRVFNYLLRLVANREDALDLSQDVFLKTYQNLRKLEDPARFPAGCIAGTITVGGLSGTATVTKFAAQAAPLVRATALNFQVPGTVAAGSAAQIRLSCTVGGVTHSTRWSGTVANAPPPPPPPCTPTTCAAQGKNCGTIPDGCGGTLTCGVCTAPQTCGGAAVANVCAVPLPAATLTLTASGRAGETISSTPAGLSVRVGTTGSASFPGGTRITLRDTNGRSVIWSGVCSSAGNKTPTCTFTLIANASETANVQ